VEGFRFATSHSARPVKVVLTGPYTLGRLSQQPGYPNLRSLVLDLARIINREAIALQDAGAPFVQFDEPAILKHEEDMPLLEEASAIVTDGLTTKTGLSTYFGDVSGLVPDLFRLPYSVIGLDFAWGPANYDLLDRFPEDKELAMGLLDARNTRLEPVDEIVEAVRRVNAHVPLDRLQLSPSCGLDFLPRANARQKLARLAEGARKAQEALG
jgi:5-methyltetrahydropteroyltriglutamate--homocysteine methyltransferase